MNPPRYPSLTVDRAITILKLIGKSEQQEMGISEIARDLDLSKSAVHRIISTLEFHGCVQQNPSNSKYRLGLTLFELGNSVPLLGSRKGPDHSHLLYYLCDSVGETVNLAVPDGKWVLLVEQVQPKTPLKIVMTLGEREPIHATALGKVILANKIEEEIVNLLGKDPLPKFGPKSITDIKELIEHLKLVRRRHYAIDDEEFAPGLRCVAVPIRNFALEVVAALSISGPTQRLSMDECKSALPLLFEVGDKISQMMGYTKNSI